MRRFATSLLCSISVSLWRQGIAPPASGGTVVGAAPPCSQCNEVVGRVLPLLPKRPVRVVVIDTSHSTRLLRDKLKGVEGFVTTGKSTVYLTKQGSTFTCPERSRHLGLRPCHYGLARDGSPGGCERV